MIDMALSAMEALAVATVVPRCRAALLACEAETQNPIETLLSAAAGLICPNEAEVRGWRSILRLVLGAYVISTVPCSKSFKYIWTSCSCNHQRDKGACIA